MSFVQQVESAISGHQYPRSPSFSRNNCLIPPHISPKPPKERKKQNRKSLKKISQENFWDLQGSCHLRKFSWTSKCFGYDSNLGRSYYTSFRFCNEEYSVGDFIFCDKDESPDVFRIVGVFQALKSFHGHTYGKNLEIQKRGHPYALVVPLILHNKIGTFHYKHRYLIKDNIDVHYFESKNKKKRKHPSDSKLTHDQHIIYDNELFLKDECKPNIDYIYSNNVIVVPEWIGYWETNYDSIRKIKVKICNDPAENIRKVRSNRFILLLNDH